MIYRRERPKCRKVLLHLCQKYDCTLEKLLDHSCIHFSHDFRSQAHKMISEGEFRSAKELKNFEHRKMLCRAVGLIR